MAAITWETDFQKALGRAQSNQKTVLLDFFNPG